MTRASRWGLLLGLLVIGVGVDRAEAQDPSVDTTIGVTTITFISGSQIFIGAGRRDGLVEEAEVEVVRGDVAVATLRVRFLASHRSACEWTKGANDIVLGDVVRFRRQPESPKTAAVRTRRPRRMSGPGIHGRFGSRYLHATTSTPAGDTQAFGSGLNQLSVDARVNGRSIGNTPLGLALDVRVRQTTTSAAGVNRVDGRTRVYQGVLLWNAPTSSFHVSAGRQYLTSVSSIGLFDGALVELNASHLSFGAFGGFEPDPATLGFSTSVRDVGSYVAVHNAPGALSSVSATVGVVGSYEGGRERREWGIAQMSMNNRYLALYLLQEIDYFRPWKREGSNAEKHPFSLTSQFANLSLRAARWLSLSGTYDRRRNVPTIRDFTNPETNFDDAYREGYGAGLQLTGNHVYAGGDWRRSTGGAVGGANSYTVTGGANRITGLNLGVSGRVTWYRNESRTATDSVAISATSGQLYSGRMSIEPLAVLHIDLNAGRRQERTPSAVGPQRSTWYGADVDVNFARSWFASFSALSQKDPVNPGMTTLTQVYGGLTWRF